MARQKGEREWQLDFMFQLYVDGRMYEYVKKKERRRRIKAKGAREARRRSPGAIVIPVQFKFPAIFRRLGSPRRL